MGLFSKSKPKLKRKSADFWVSKNQLTYFDFTQNSDIFIAINSVPELNSILNYISKSFSAGIWQIDDEKDKWLTDLLSKPHTAYSENELKTLIAKELISYGVCFLYANKNSIISSTKSIVVLPTHLTNAVTTKKNSSVLEIEKLSDIIDYIQVDYIDGVKKIDASDVIIISQSNIFEIKNNTIVFKSPLKSLDNVLKTSTAIYETMYELNFNRGAVGIISNDNQDASGTIPMTPEEIENLQKQYKRYGTLRDKWHLMFSDTKLSFQAISSPIKDMMLPEQLKQVKQIIADVLGFDTLLLNNTDGNKYANYNEARKSFFTELIQPLADNVANSLTDYFLSERKSKLTLDYSHLDIFKQDNERQANIIKLQSEMIINLNNAVSTNEISREIAIQILTQNGFSEIDANNLIK